MIRAYIREDLPGMFLEVALIQVADDVPRRILRVMDAASGKYRWEDIPEQPPRDLAPTLQIGDEEARALLEALVRHYQGTDDTRALRRDYDAERKRVDDLTSALASLAQNLAAGRTSTPATLTVPGANNNRCVRCGMARALRLEDGSIEWVTSPATPPHCNHELWAEP